MKPLPSDAVTLPRQQMFVVKFDLPWAFKLRKPNARRVKFFLINLLSALLLLVCNGCQVGQYWIRKPKQQVTPDATRVTYLSTIAQQLGIDKADNSIEQPSFEEDETGNDQQRSDVDFSTADEAVNVTETGELKLFEADVIESVLNYFPQIQAVLLEAQVVQGNLTAAMGAFDLNLAGQTTSQPLGFYQTYRNSLGANQNLFSSGGNIYAGYRIGRGTFPIWYKDRETNDGGEFAVGGIVPLRQNRLIDSRRANVFRAQQDVQAVEPLIRNQQNEIARIAKLAYWSWVGAGTELKTQSRLLELAKARAIFIEAQVRRGDLPRLAQIDNDRLIAQRLARYIESSRKFEAAQINLSLFLRDDAGRLLVAESEFVPDFPRLSPIQQENLQNDISQAINVQPQIEELDFSIEKARINLEEACNLILARVDGFAEASQDVGARSSPIGDKSPFEMQLGVIAEVPLQRRLGIGRVTTAQAKLRQLEWARELLANQIKTAVQDAYSAIENAINQFEAADTNVSLAKEALAIGKVAFEVGDIDLIVLNIYEQSVADAELQVIQAAFNYFAALADYQFAMGNF